MWLYIRQLFELLLSPSSGWDEVSARAATPEQVERKGFYPWLAVTALSEFVRLAYNPALTFLGALGAAIIVGGAMFVSLYAARLLLDVTLRPHVDGTLNVAKVGVFAEYMVGMTCLFRIVANLLPASLTLVHFLPLLSALVIFKGARYVGVKTDSLMTFLFWGVIATVFIPMFATSLLMLVIEP